MVEMVVVFRNCKAIGIRTAELDYADFELIIGAPSIQHLDLLPILDNNLKTLPPLTEICAHNHDPQLHRSKTLLNAIIENCDKNPLTH
jgi:hypothetical protein